MKVKHRTPYIKRLLEQDARQKTPPDTGSISYQSGYLDGWCDAHDLRDNEEELEKLKREGGL